MLFYFLNILKDVVFNEIVCVDHKAPSLAEELLATDGC